MSDDFQKELRFLGVKSSPAFVRQPEGNGCFERFFRSLKQQLLWVRHFDDIEQLRLALVQFRETYNRHCLVQRLQFRTPWQAGKISLHKPLLLEYTQFTVQAIGGGTFVIIMEEA